VNDEPKQVSADQDPKGSIANYRNIRKDSHNRRHREPGNGSEEHFEPKVTIGRSKERERFLESAGGFIRFTMPGRNVYLESMPQKPLAVPMKFGQSLVKDMRLYFAESSAIKRDEIRE
jgi:hypothetical protein